MNDNLSPFASNEYDIKIRQTLPYYDEFYKQIIELVQTVYSTPVSWLDAGCGTGKMGEEAYGSNIELKKFVFCDSSAEMISISEERFAADSAEFCICDIRNLPYENEFDIVTAVQVLHYLQADEREGALKRCYKALKDSGSFIYFENIAPFTEFGKSVYLEKWKNSQLKMGKSPEECENHIGRYGKDYFPLTIEEHLKLMRDCGFRIVELLWLSNMQAGFWGMK